MLRLNELRGNYTQVQMAQILGLPRETYRNYEVGKREPPIDVLIKIAKHFGVSVDYLIGYDSSSSSSSCDFTLEEQALIEQYRRVPDERLKKLLRDQLKILSGNNN